MQSPKSLKNVALFGLGEAGTLIAIDLQKAGISVTAYDLSLIHISEPTRPY